VSVTLGSSLGKDLISMDAMMQVVGLVSGGGLETRRVGVDLVGSDCSEQREFDTFGECECECFCV